jgi:hypothetical protein
VDRVLEGLNLPSWEVEIYYSGFTIIQVEATDEDEAILKGREEALRRLEQAVIVDADGAMAQLVQSLEPWEECDTAKRLQ